MFYLKLDNESGMAMVVAVIVTIIGSILASSYLTVVLYESKNSVWQKHKAQSLFLAEAGIQKGLYYLNNRYDDANPWTDENGQLLGEMPLVSERLVEGRYEISLYDQFDMPPLPANSFLMKSVGIIPRADDDDIVRSVSCIVAQLGGLPIPASLGIMDAADPEDELLKFNSNRWTISGEDIDGLGGLPGIAVANSGDDLAGQLGSRLDQVTGSDEWSTQYAGKDAIVENPNLPTDLDDYVNYFRDIAIDISGMVEIPGALLGTSDRYQILRADLSQGDLRIAGNGTGYGILLLEGNGEFVMAGRLEWNGVIICAGGSHISLRGGGSGNHIYGSLLIANGSIEMNGTADIKYSSANMSKVNTQLLLYQVSSWCGGWGNSLDAQVSQSE